MYDSKTISGEPVFPYPSSIDHLRPCPFCGGAASICKCEHPRVYGIENKPYYVQCECGLLLGYDIDYGGTFDTKAEAAEAWNTQYGQKPVNRKDWLRSKIANEKNVLKEYPPTWQMEKTHSLSLIEEWEDELAEVEYREWSDPLSDLYRLKPCPLCGSSPEWFREEAKDQKGVYWYGVMCPQCDHHGPLTMIPAKQCAEVAANLWNSQTVEDIERNFPELIDGKDEG